jgi:hypothetical protein
MHKIVAALTINVWFLGDPLSSNNLRTLPALMAIDAAVFLYNTKRPHLAINYETPEKCTVRLLN